MYRPGFEPVASLSRLAARPVGAHSTMRTPLAARMRRMALTRVVLPTPGPPVMTVAFDVSARRTASAWLAASDKPVRCSTQDSALPASMSGHGRCPSAMRRNRSAITRSARYRPARNTQSVPATAAATTVPSASSRSSAVRTNSPGTSTNSAASATSSSTGNPQ